MSGLTDQHVELVDRIYHHLEDVRQRHELDWTVRKEVRFFDRGEEKVPGREDGEMDIAILDGDSVDYLEVKTNGREKKGRQQVRDAREHFEQHGFELTGEVYAVESEVDRDRHDLLNAIRTELDTFFTPDELRGIMEYEKETGIFGKLVEDDEVVEVTGITDAEEAVNDPRYDHEAMQQYGLIEEADDGYTRTKTFWDHRGDAKLYQVARQQMDVPTLDAAEQELLSRIDDAVDGTFAYQEVCDMFDDQDDGRFGQLVNADAINDAADLPREYAVEGGLDQGVSHSQLERDGRYDDELLVEEGYLEEDEQGRYRLDERPDEGTYHIAPEAAF